MFEHEEPRTRRKAGKGRVAWVLGEGEVGQVERTQISSKTMESVIGAFKQGWQPVLYQTRGRAE